MDNIDFQDLWLICAIMYICGVSHLTKNVVCFRTTVAHNSNHILRYFYLFYYLSKSII